jgi:hypothetical protein
MDLATNFIERITRTPGAITPWCAKKPPVRLVGAADAREEEGSTRTDDCACMKAPEERKARRGEDYTARREID